MFRRLITLVLVLTASLTLLGAAGSQDRYGRLGHQLMCPCGCSEILLECNHVGCPDSSRMTRELRDQLQLGLTDAAVITWFSDKYGPTVVASPMRDNWFDRTTWYVPFGVLLLGAFAVVLVVRHWKRRLPALEAASAVPVVADPIAERIRRETSDGL